MQGSRIEGNRSNWKQAVKKSNPPSSKVFAENRELPNKFSPAKFNVLENNSRSLIRNRTNNYSNDEIMLEQSRERSKSKDLELRKGQTTNVPQLIKNESELPILKKGPQSQKSIDFQIKRNFVSVRSGDIDMVRELKQQFLRFKQKILRELGRQEQQLRRAIQLIYQHVGNLSRFVQSPIPSRSSPSTSKVIQIVTPVIQIVTPIQTYQSPISKYLQTFGKQVSSRIQTFPEQRVKTESNNANSDSVTPQIKTRMGKVQELLGILKHQLNDQHPKSEKMQQLAALRVLFT